MKTAIIILLFPIFLISKPVCFTPHSNIYQSDKQNKVQNFHFSRTKMNKIHYSKEGYFAIHYDTMGGNKVDLTDNDNNGVPDYVDSVAYYADLAFQKMVIEDKFEANYLDNASAELDDTEVYDIYLKQLGEDNYYGGTVKDPSGATTFIVIDNDFSPLDSGSVNDEIVQTYNTFGIDGMKITVFHEFHHAIQQQMHSKNSRIIAEMSSTYIEYKYFPEIKEYITWIDDLYIRPEAASLTQNGSPDLGYSYSIFFQYTNKKFGDGFLLQLWKYVQSGSNEVEALEMVLNDNGSSLVEAYKEFCNWLYFTGSNAVEGEYFDDAEFFPDIRWSSELTLKDNDVNIFKFLTPFSFSPIRVIVPGSFSRSEDTLDLMFVNLDWESGKNSSTNESDVDFKISANDVSGSEPLEKLNYFYIDNSDGVIDLHSYEIPGQQADEIDFAYPMPYDPNEGDNLIFPAPEKVYMYENVEIALYTAEMEQKVFYKTSVTAANEKKVAIMPNHLLDDLSTGVYIFSITSGNSERMGKVIIRRK